MRSADETMSAMSDTALVSTFKWSRRMARRAFALAFIALPAGLWLDWRWLVMSLAFLIAGVSMACLASAYNTEAAKRLERRTAA